MADRREMRISVPATAQQLPHSRCKHHSLSFVPTHPPNSLLSHNNSRRPSTRHSPAPPKFNSSSRISHASTTTPASSSRQRASRNRKTGNAAGHESCAALARWSGRFGDCRASMHRFVRREGAHGGEGRDLRPLRRPALFRTIVASRNIGIGRKGHLHRCRIQCGGVRGRQDLRC